MTINLISQLDILTKSSCVLKGFPIHHTEDVSLLVVLFGLNYRH